jgi:dethiobiotin synthetase
VTRLFVSGTGTEVGKTWWAAALLRAERAAGRAVAARKPAQSFAPGDGATDAEVLGAASGEDPERVCPPHRWYERALAPPMAAVELGRDSFSVHDLVAETCVDGTPELELIEGAGGPCSPLAMDGDNVDVAAALGVDVVLLVGDAGLGTINAVRLAAAAFAARMPDAPLVVALNRYDGGSLHAANRAWLRDRDRYEVVVTPDALVGRWTT